MASEAPEIMESLDLNAISSRPWSIQACSAMTKTGLEEGMKWLIDTINAKNLEKTKAAAAK